MLTIYRFIFLYVLFLFFAPINGSKEHRQGHKKIVPIESKEHRQGHKKIVPIESKEQQKAFTQGQFSAHC